MCWRYCSHVLSSQSNKRKCSCTRARKGEYRAPQRFRVTWITRIHKWRRLALTHTHFLSPFIRHVVVFGRRQRSRGKGAIGSGGGAHTFNWVREGWLASWLAEERVVEALLEESEQDADPVGTTCVAKDGDGPRRVRIQTDDKTIYFVRLVSLYKVRSVRLPAQSRNKTQTRGSTQKQSAM